MKEVYGSRHLLINDNLPVLRIVCGRAQQTLSILLNGHRGLFPAMALRLEKPFGMRMDTLRKRQSAGDIAEARKREGEFDSPRFMAT